MAREGEEDWWALCWLFPRVWDVLEGGHLGAHSSRTGSSPWWVLLTPHVSLLPPNNCLPWGLPLSSRILQDLCQGAGTLKRVFIRGSSGKCQGWTAWIWREIWGAPSPSPSPGTFLRLPVNLGPVHWPCQLPASWVSRSLNCYSCPVIWTVCDLLLLALNYKYIHPYT